MSKDQRQYIVLLIHPNGSVEMTRQDKAPDYPQLRAAVGGMIQTVPYWTKAEYDGKKLTRGTAYANEEGILLGLAPNRMATLSWASHYPHATTLCGTCIFYAKEPK